MGIRLDDVTPAFDVFSLGKVLWAMVSGRTKMQLWYFDNPKFNVKHQFPRDERMALINRILAGCIVQHEDSCWRSARELLDTIDETLLILRRGGQVVNTDVVRYCLVCGSGHYVNVPSTSNDMEPLRSVGLGLLLRRPDQASALSMHPLWAHASLSCRWKPASMGRAGRVIAGQLPFAGQASLVLLLLLPLWPILGLS
jgi:hypothetical protein